MIDKKELGLAWEEYYEACSFERPLYSIYFILNLLEEELKKKTPCYLLDVSKGTPTNDETTR